MGTQEEEEELWLRQGGGGGGGWGEAAREEGLGSRNRRDPRAPAPHLCLVREARGKEDVRKGKRAEVGSRELEEPRVPGVSTRSPGTAGRGKRCRGGPKNRWRRGAGVAGWRGWRAGGTGTPSRAAKGRDEEHGGKRIGLAWKMGKGKEDNRATGCCGQRVRSEQWLVADGCVYKNRKQEAAPACGF